MPYTFSDLGRFVLVTGLLSFFCAPVQKLNKGSESNGRQVETLNKNYHRIRSKVMARRIKTPTRANLDFAAYDANVMLYDSMAFKPKAPENQPSMADLNFGNALVGSTICNRLEDVPISSQAKGSPLHWKSLREYLLLWDFDKCQEFVMACNHITETRWGNDDIHIPIQELTALYLERQTEGHFKIWGKVEFKPWASIFTAITDNDKDGFPEIFGQLNPSLLTPELRNYIQMDYVGKVFDREEVITWANELSSYWYPSYNTDIDRTPANNIFPNAETDQNVLPELGNLTINKPTVVIKGKPFNEAIYNVFVVDNMKGIYEEEVTDSVLAANKLDQNKADPSAGVAIQANLKRFEEDLQRYGEGDYAAWTAQYSALHRAIQEKLDAIPDGANAVAGTDGFIFFDRSLKFLIAGDLRKQEEDKNPFPVIVNLKNQLLEMGIEFLFVPVPVKPAVYADQISGKAPKGPFVNPYGRKFLHDLSKAKVEVLDLLPRMIEEREKKCPGCEPIFQLQDTHWTTRGLELTAAAIGDRIKQYAFYKDLEKTEFKIQEVKIKRMGDIVTRMPAAEQTKYRPAELLARQIMFHDGALYRDKKASSILILGDSFTGVYQRTDARHAGVSAHVAKNVSYPMHLKMSYGGGPTVIQRLQKMGKAGLAGKKLVIWIMVMRDLYAYWDAWKVVDLK